MKSIVIAALLILVLPTPASAERRPEQWRTTLHWSIGASVACDALDLHSTYVVLRARSDAREANFLYGDVQDRRKAVAIKLAGSAVLTAVSVKIHDDYPLPSLLLNVGNAAIKCGFAARHYRLAREGSANASVRLAIKLSF